MTTSMDRDHFFDFWLHSESVSPNIAASRSFEPSDGRFVPFPSDLAWEISSALKTSGISALYSHQDQSFRAAAMKENLVITTGTSSGKTLCYNLPVLNSLIRNPESSALYVFPTKALAQDQLNGLRKLISEINDQTPSTNGRLLPEHVAVYDGDTPSSTRSFLRGNARILITNPDMIHIGILPHHTLWQDFFKGLQFVVLDEIHLYRGVFGSHIANVLRRLKRVAMFYGRTPQYFLTSATIANAKEHAQRLIEEPVTSFNLDGSPRGKKQFILYNPPLINPDLGIRRSTVTEANLISLDLFQNRIQAIVFSRSRREVEVILRNLLASLPTVDAKKVRGYRAGYLPKERREIETGLRDGSVRLVVATNALELGVDIGGMDAIVIVGYPGSIASVRQQAGRSGRRQGSSLAVFLATQSPLDQYLIRNPDFLLERSPEQALIDADNLLILLEHIKAAAFELPFEPGEEFGNLPGGKTLEFLEYLKEEGFLVDRGNRFFWMADQYPASKVSLRNASSAQITLRAPSKIGLQTIGIVDYTSALWMTHPQAIYLQEGQQYRVENLDLSTGEAILRPGDYDYFTVPQTDVQINIEEFLLNQAIQGGTKSFGEILVSETVSGYKKIRWDSQEVLGVEPIEGLPTTELRTTGYWLSLDENSIESLKQKGLWSSQPNRYGKDWEKTRLTVRRRDFFTCQSCGKVEPTMQEFHVHHRIPFKQFSSPQEANRLENLVTLCPICHMKAEAVLRIRSGLSGARYAMSNLAPLFLMCDPRDLGSAADPLCKFADGQPTIIFYDQVPGGVGFADHLYKHHDQVIHAVVDLISGCGCGDGCPACVGAAGMQAEGGKMETLALLEFLTG